jgi:UDP-N-acetylmuramate--alanine ligase
MRAMPLDIGVLHFVGIGGIGMSGIAEVLVALGYQVQGSDISDSPNVKRLRDQGVKIEIGHREENIKGSSVVVVSSAIQPDNPELLEARKLNIPVVRRAEMLAELMRLKWAIAIGGTHGKTTTTSLVGTMLEEAGFDPTVVNGGIINRYGTNVRVGGGEWMVVEADESDGTFTKLPAAVTVVTNIDPEHMEHYGDFDTLRAAFRQYIENIPFYGFAVLCTDHPEVQALVSQIQDRRLISYGTNLQADVRALNIKSTKDGSTFDVEFSSRLRGEESVLRDVFLPMLGEHNVLNALSALSIAYEMNIAPPIMKSALKNFGGVKRRFTKTGEVNGITIIDDYGHHPVEIIAVLKAARMAVEDSGGRVIAVVQPHRYSRLQDLFEEFCTCFNDADTVLVSDVYEAGEEPIEGINSASLIEGIRGHGHKDVHALINGEALPSQVSDIAKSGDFVVCLGAGDITKWANALPEELKKYMASNDKQRA